MLAVRVFLSYAKVGFPFTLFGGKLPLLIVYDQEAEGPLRLCELATDIQIRQLRN